MTLVNESESARRPLIAVVAAVISRGNLYLLCQRPAGKLHAGLWEFPGGKVRDGETHAAALERELSEELGLRVANAGPSRYERADKDAGVTVVFHDVEVIGEPQLVEHAAIGWCPVDALTRMSLAPSDADFVRDALVG